MQRLRTKLRTKLRGLAGAAALIALFCVPSVLAQQKVFRIAIPDRTEHFTSIPSMQNLLTRAYAHLGIRIHWVPIPLKRSEALLALGQIDAEVVRLKPDPRFAGKVIRVDIPLMELNTAAFAIDPSIRIKNVESLACCRVGINNNFRSSERLAKYANGVERAETLGELVRMLKIGRVDVVLGVYRSGQSPRSALGPNETPEILVVNDQLEKVPGYHYLAAKHANLAKPLADALRIEMK